MPARCFILLIGALLASCQSSVVSPRLACVITIPQDPVTLRYGFDGFGRVGQTTDPGPIPCVRRLSEQDQLCLEDQIATLGLEAPPESVVLATPCPLGMVQVDLAANGRRWSHRLPQEQAEELLRFCQRCTGQGGGAELPNARYAWEGDPWAIWRQGQSSD